MLFVLVLVMIVRRVVRATCALAASNGLRISHNHFVHGGMVPLSRVVAIEGCRSVGFNDFSIASCVLVRCKGKGFISIVPIGRRRFTRLLRGEVFRGGVGSLRTVSSMSPRRSRP